MTWFALVVGAALVIHVLIEKSHGIKRLFTAGNDQTYIQN